MTDASERERQLDNLIHKVRAGKDISGDDMKLVFVAATTRIESMHEKLRADDETIRGLEAKLRDVYRYKDEYEKQLAAQSAELERVRKDAERYQAICMRLRGLGGYSIGIIAQHAFSDDAQLLVGPEADAAIDAALAAPSAAGGEKEG